MFIEEAPPVGRKRPREQFDDNDIVQSWTPENRKCEYNLDHIMDKQPFSFFFCGADCFSLFPY
jgi:hypothetical protein